MNKKLAMLLIPLLLVPMASFAYAHYTDKVEKKYKIHVGSIVANMTYFHVDKLKTLDTNCNGYIWDDEFNITIYEDPATCTWYVLIACNPIPPSFELDTTMKVHNVGKLPWVAYWEVMYAGPYDYDYYGCFEGWDENDFELLADYPTGGRAKDNFMIPGWYLENGLIYDITFWKDGVIGEVGPTSQIYHPCTNLTIKQNVTLLQPPASPMLDPNDDWSDDWQKNIQCHWFLIWVKIVVQNPTPSEYSSATWEDGEWTSYGNIPRD
ncbi:MAG: hypothetical protein OEZ29_06205 [Candidatus Bathyarchaeota archaeon]|nr:hypothetical protein [Candidatus Bathyarchaeota archaeon]